MGRERALAWFTTWFASAACVWQTTIVVIAVAIVELGHPALDRHGFWLLWALTLFSAITQPALAHSGAVSATHLETILDRLTLLEQQAVDRETILAQRLDLIDARIEQLTTSRFGA